jgi:hypothetical protein
MIYPGPVQIQHPTRTCHHCLCSCILDNLPFLLLFPLRLLPHPIALDPAQESYPTKASSSYPVTLFLLALPPLLIQHIRPFAIPTFHMKPSNLVSSPTVLTSSGLTRIPRSAKKALSPAKRANSFFSSAAYLSRASLPSASYNTTNARIVRATQQQASEYFLTPICTPSNAFIRASQRALMLRRLPEP